MGKLGVREKSLIHQVNRTSTPTPAVVNSGFIPAFLQDFDEPNDGVPGGQGNFGKLTTIVNNAFYLFPQNDEDDFPSIPPGGASNFGQSSGGSSTTNNYTTNNYISVAQEPDDQEFSPPFAVGNFNRGGPTSNLRGLGCQFISAGLGLPLAGTLVDEVTVPYGGTVTSWAIVGDVSGSASILVEHATYANYDTMTTLFTGTVSSAKKNQATGTSYTVAPGDIVRFTGSGFASFTRCNITLTVNPN